MPSAQLISPEAHATIPERFRYVARCLPEQVAVVDASGPMTYAALDAESDRLAACLLSRFGPDPEPVALLMPNTASAAVAILGVLKAGKFYVPLDPGPAVETQRVVLRLSLARILLTTTALLPGAQTLAAPDTQVVALDVPRFDEGVAAPPAPAITASTYACVLFTSGSTGIPKGVIWHHGAYLNRCWQSLRYDRVSPEDRVSQLFSPGFAPYSSILFVTLLNGATLFPYPANGPGLAALFDWLALQAITLFYAPVSLLRDLLSLAVDVRPLPALRAVVLGGQRIVARELLGLPALLPPGCVVVNRLSMSELHLLTWYEIGEQEFRPTADPVPVGYVCEGHEIILQNEKGEATPPGEIGQIVVRSPYLSPGYWRDPEQTALKFRLDPEGGNRRLFYTGDLGRLRPDGCLEYCGRMDFMVKIRGFRVEPEAINAALMGHPGLLESVVVAESAPGGDPRLIAYFVPRQIPGPTLGELRQRLAQTLPAYMIPARFVRLASLPRNISGKIDRSALPPPGRARPDVASPFIAPQTALQAELASLWAELLELDEVGVEDSFFELGGDSLLALRMILEAEKLVNATVPADYFHHPTIATLAQLSVPGESARPVPPSVPTRRTEAEPLLSRARIVRLLTGRVAIHMLLRSAVDNLVPRLPYTRALRWLAWIGQPAIANWLFRDERELFSFLAEGLGNPAAASAEAFRASVIGNVIWLCFQQAWTGVPRPPDGLMAAMRTAPELFWRTFADRVDHASPQERERPVQFSGLEHLYLAQKRGRGTLLLTYHSPAMPIANAILSRYTSLGHIPTLSQQWSTHLAMLDQAGAEEGLACRTSAWSAAHTLEAQRRLRQGGVVQVVNDVSYKDRTSIRKSIGGRAYDLKPGFAELALATGAGVVPVYGTYDAGGCVRMTFLPALEPPAGAVDHQAYVHHMLDQYIAFLENIWQKTPESVGWGAMRRYRDCPPFSQADSR